MAAAYSLADKTIAIGIIERFGGQVTHEALLMIRQALDLPKLNKSTVWRWWVVYSANHGELQPQLLLQPEKMQAEQALDQMFEKTAKLYLGHAVKDEVIAKMNGQQAVTAAAIATDKMRLLRDLPTEIIGILPDLLEAIQQRGLRPGDVFEAMLAELVSSNDGD